MNDRLDEATERYGDRRDRIRKHRDDAMARVTEAQKQLCPNHHSPICTECGHPAPKETPDV
ncbi:hypothetical protein [Mumia sp. DW29H23]|uniref:hypothetical protein n=1 Tax=Mumia sp. DW29H23 TaxID=3421241 RepID=UPI003D698D41